MVRPTSAFYEMTLVGGTLAIGLRESRSGCCIADDTGEVDTPKGSPAQIRSALPSIVLQNSFCIDQHKFSGPYVRRSTNNLRDYVVL
jgi:hypothetical protein